MPYNLNIFVQLFTEHLNDVLNIGIIISTFFETYLFPLSLVKWIIVVTKFGGALVQMQASVPIKLRTRYQYKLQLITRQLCYLGTSEVVEEISNVNLLMESDVMQLSYCGQECRKIPPALHKMYGVKVKCLDLSYNSIETLKGLDHFTRLEELILDNNKLGDSISFPYIATLKTLSLNNNQLSDLDELVNKISKRFPSLTYLSLLSNKACPNQLSDIDKDDSDYQRYRYFVIYMLPNLRFLDSRRVSTSERREASVRGEFMRVRRPPDTEVSPLPQSLNEPLARPMPVDLSALGKHKGAYGKCNYKYTGKHSEGNRFIVNSDL